MQESFSPHHPSSLSCINEYLVLVSARFIDASMYRDTCHAIRITIQLGRIAIFFLVVPEVGSFLLSSLNNLQSIISKAFVASNTVPYTP